ncbi:MAG: glycosyltransferase family 4 protein [Actinomycetota bacterium]|nr:glycosyltransferase family 4 protein [Actinomycetota bacterium]
MSFRLGGTDGVAVVARSWGRALRALGFEVVTVAGTGPVDRLVPGLGWPDDGALLERRAVAEALGDAALVVVENLCSLPLNPRAGATVAEELAGRPAVLHHHDLPWQRPHLAAVTGWPPQDPVWRHVAISELSRRELASRGIAATVIRNGFDVDPHTGGGDRSGTRRLLEVAPEERLLLHPVRALPRKDVPAALALAEALGATYWLTGPAEEGYGPELARVLAGARGRVVHRPAPTTMADAYAACDAVVLASTWEGFGNPLVEAALHRRPLAVAGYPVAEEVGALGFRWFPVHDHRPLEAFLRQSDEALHDHNATLARRHFSLARVTADLEALLGEAGWI